MPSNKNSIASNQSYTFNNASSLTENKVNDDENKNIMNSDQQRLPISIKLEKVKKGTKVVVPTEKISKKVIFL